MLEFLASVWLILEIIGILIPAVLLILLSGICLLAWHVENKKNRK